MVRVVTTPWVVRSSSVSVPLADATQMPPAVSTRPIGCAATGTVSGLVSAGVNTVTVLSVAFAT